MRIAEIDHVRNVLQLPHQIDVTIAWLITNFGNFVFGFFIILVA